MTRGLLLKRCFCCWFANCHNLRSSFTCLSLCHGYINRGQSRSIVFGFIFAFTFRSFNVVLTFSSDLYVIRVNFLQLCCACMSRELVRNSQVIRPIKYFHTAVSAEFLPVVIRLNTKTENLSHTQNHHTGFCRDS